MTSSTASRGDESDVLFVGAVPRDARVVSCGLEREDISMDIAADIRTAIDRLTRASEERTDVNLPRLMIVDLTEEPDDGLTVLKAIMESPRLRTLPTIAIVDDTAPDGDVRTRVQNAYKHGVNGHISKPDSTEAYADTVQQMASFWFSRASLPPKSLYSDSASVQYG